jgi:hypothetical protein
MTNSPRTKGARGVLAGPPKPESLSHFARLLWILLRTPPPPSGHITPFVYSNPGGGKTTVAKAVSAALGVAPEHHKTLAAAQRNPEDLGGGWGVPRADGLVFEAPAVIRRLSACGAPAMLVLDEVGNADRPRQAAMLRLIHERVCGDDPIGDNVMIMMISNPPETGTDPHESARAFSNRAASLPFPSPTVAEHVAYLRRRGGAAFEFPAWDDEAFEREYEASVSLYGTFMERDPQARIEEDPDSDDLAARWPCSYATHRTWEAAVRVMAACRAVGQENDLIHLLPGIVGAPQAMALIAATKDIDLIPFQSLMDDGPEAFRPDPLRPDRTFAQLHLVAAAGTATDQGRTKEECVARFDAAMRFLHWVAVDCNEQPALCVVAGQMLAESVMEDRMLSGARLANHAKVIRKLDPYVQAAGWRVGR